MSRRRGHYSLSDIILITRKMRRPDGNFWLGHLYCKQEPRAILSELSCELLVILDPTMSRRNVPAMIYPRVYIFPHCFGRNNNEAVCNCSLSQFASSQITNQILGERLAIQILADLDTSPAQPIHNNTVISLTNYSIQSPSVVEERCQKCAEWIFPSHYGFGKSNLTRESGEDFTSCHSQKTLLPLGRGFINCINGGQTPVHRRDVTVYHHPMFPYMVGMVILRGRAETAKSWMPSLSMSLTIFRLGLASLNCLLILVAIRLAQIAMHVFVSTITSTATMSVLVIDCFLLVLTC